MMMIITHHAKVRSMAERVRQERCFWLEYFPRDPGNLTRELHRAQIDLRLARRGLAFHQPSGIRYNIRRTF